MLSPFKLHFNSLVPPPPPSFAEGHMNLKAEYHNIKYPEVTANPWNMSNYP